MHEYSLVQSLIDRVEAEARSHHATSVSRIQVAIGELSGVEADLFSKAFETFRDRTLCTNTDLAIRPVAARWTCLGCGRNFSRGDVLSCPACGLPAQLSEGDEIVLDRIEMEVP